ncbi:retinol dehydrogenase 7-like [Lineus longissimus]|uniref:retinol dehydrogenase 7-like n=1 Tax=Lineus longissimus TaxID=88925 RepID=UPI00315D4735
MVSPRDDNLSASSNLMNDNLPMMSEDRELIIDDEFLFYSVIYSTITVIFGMAVLSKFLTHEFRFGLRSLLSLGVLFVGEPMCHFLLKGVSGVLIFGLGCLFIYSILPSSHLPAHGKAVLITGCDSGFGHALAKKLDSIGMKVFAGCLESDGPGAIELKNSCSPELKVLHIDVTNQALIDAAFNVVSTSVGSEGLWGLVNNAGIWMVADIELTSQASYEKVLNINFFGVVRMSRKFIPLIRKSKGRIVNVSSILGKVPLELFSAYVASKHAIEGFSDVLRIEMRKFDIGVSVVQPGGFKTNTFMSSMINTQKEQVWQQACPEMRELYGRQHLDEVYRVFEAESANLPEDLSPVVRAMRSGLLSKLPRERYPCGTFVEPFMMFYPLLPIWIADKISFAISIPRRMKSAVSNVGSK